MPSQVCLPSLVPAPLYYEKCTTVELCKFLEDCTGVAPSKAQLQKIQGYGNYLLIDHLRELDAKRSFSRFMQLPPELRLVVYEALLIPELRSTVHEALVLEDEPLEHDATPSSIHPAILRASKQIHSEAMPVLYKQNEFRAKLEYCTVEHPFHPTLVPYVVGCSLTITRPGGKSAFCQQIPRRRGRGSLLRRLLGDRTMIMLRALTHFTIDLDLVTPGELELSAYVNQAYDAMSTLCLAFIGRSKLEELTIKVYVGDSQVVARNLAFILWPLLFLRTDVVVKIEGASGMSVVELEELKGAYMDPYEEMSFGRDIARVRRVCSAEIEKCGWKNGFEDYGFYEDGVREVERVLNRVDNFGVHVIRLDDILNRSALWERIRGEADRFEAEEESEQ